jgi:hypothetical protein
MDPKGYAASSARCLPGSVRLAATIGPTWRWIALGGRVRIERRRCLERLAEPTPDEGERDARLDEDRRDPVAQAVGTELHPDPGLPCPYGEQLVDAVRRQ